MTPAEGIERLIFHTRPEEGSFLAVLRPYRGLRLEVLDDLRAALRASASEISVDNPSRELRSALWSLSHLGRSWALDPEGVLRRNGLVDDADRCSLHAFLEWFDDAVMSLLDRESEHEAITGLGIPIDTASRSKGHRNR